MQRKSIQEEGYAVLQERLIEERTKAGLTQMQLAAKLHKPQSYVSKYERGERRLDVIEFILIARALGIEPGLTVMHVDMNMPVEKRRVSK